MIGNVPAKVHGFRSHAVDLGWMGSILLTPPPPHEPQVGLADRFHRPGRLVG